MPSHHIPVSHFADYWPDRPDLVRVTDENRGWETVWAADGLEFCQTVLGYLPPVRYDVRLSTGCDGNGVSGWRESVIADFATDADLVAFRLRFPEA